MEKAGLTDKLESVVVLDGLSSRDLQATARAATDPFFLHIIGIEAFDAQAGSRAAQAITNVEIALVLDVSGSMLGAKITNLRTAASHFVAELGLWRAHHSTQSRTADDGAVGSISRHLDG